jgi:hypothetical protein
LTLARGMTCPARGRYRILTVTPHLRQRPTTIQLLLPATRHSHGDTAGAFRSATLLLLPASARLGRPPRDDRCGRVGSVGYAVARTVASPGAAEAGMRGVAAFGCRPTRAYAERLSRRLPAAESDTLGADRRAQLAWERGLGSRRVRCLSVGVGPSRVARRRAGRSPSTARPPIGRPGCSGARGDTGGPRSSAPCARGPPCRPGLHRRR